MAIANLQCWYFSCKAAELSSFWVTDTFDHLVVPLARENFHFLGSWDVEKQLPYLGFCGTCEDSRLTFDRWTRNKQNPEK